jgi:hypothetical protein
MSGDYDSTETYDAIGYDASGNIIVCIEASTRNAAIRAMNRIIKEKFLYTGLSRVDVVSNDTDIVSLSKTV